MCYPRSYTCIYEEKKKDALHFVTMENTYNSVCIFCALECSNVQKVTACHYNTSVMETGTVKKEVMRENFAVTLHVQVSFVVKISPRVFTKIMCVITIFIAFFPKMMSKFVCPMNVLEIVAVGDM